MQQALEQMDTHKAWDYETKIQQILSELKVGNLQQAVSSLSGGQEKRVALAKILIDEPDLLILDEPTNHLDLDMIAWLEEYLSQKRLSLLMVTHDRYFLENVCNEILELADGTLYRHLGNYSYFLEQKEIRETQQATEVTKARNLMRKELDWIRRQPKARGTKAKYRVEAFEGIKEKASQNTATQQLQVDSQMSRLGKKILEFEKVSKRFGDIIITQDFDYVFKRKERVGIVGHNGVGKSSFLQMLTGQLAPDSGQITKGETVVFGYYTQGGLQLPEDKRVLEVIQDIAEKIELGGGQTASPTQLLEQFMFDKDRRYAYVSTLSGGEKRRLYLLTVLLQKPNFLILDEPTNDLDLLTLNVLEEFLANFEGCLLVVTHDRYFLDKLADHLLIFEGQGVIRDYNGQYSDYRAELAIEKAEAQKPSPKTPVETPKPAHPVAAAPAKKKLSFKEQREYEALEAEIAELEAQKEALTAEMSGDQQDHEALQQLAEKLEKLIQTIDEKTDRWLTLAESA
jgi:ATP-binding cassette subfamily F protein uup